MKRIVLMVLLLCTVFILLDVQHVFGEEFKVLDKTISMYKDAASQWEPAIKKHAKVLFWALATLSMIFTFGYMAVKGQSSLGDYFSEFIRFSITIGFFFWLLENGSYIAETIIQSLHNIGREASTTYVLELTPSNIITFGFSLVMNAYESIPRAGYVMGITMLAVTVVIMGIFAIIATIMVLLLVHAWVLVYAGIFFLGFGGGRWTSDIAINYFKTVLGMAVQIFVFCLLIGIGEMQVTSMITKANSLKTVKVSGVWATITGNTEITTTSLTIPDVCMILCFAIMLVILVGTLPASIAGIISGTGGGTSSFGGAGAIVGAATGFTATAAAAGAMVGSQLAGAGMALNSAYQKSKTDNMIGALTDLAGGSAGGGSSGGQTSWGGGGLAGAMNRGVMAAGDTLSNLVSGASQQAKSEIRDLQEHVQETTFTGGVSKQLDAMNTQDEGEALAPEGRTLSVNAGGGGSESAPSVQSGSGGSDGADGVVISSGSTDPGGFPESQAQAVQAANGSEGVVSSEQNEPGTPYSQESESSSAGEGVMEGDGTGQRSGLSKETREKSTFERFGYDPSKIGRPDDS